VCAFVVIAIWIIFTLIAWILRSYLRYNRDMNANFSRVYVARLQADYARRLAIKARRVADRANEAKSAFLSFLCHVGNQ
jgi:anaerobic C4-dicarboxylate transporter